jgi:hypothetical protein
LPVQVDLVHVALTQLDWSLAQFRLAEQSEDGIGQPHVIVRSARLEFPAHLPDTLDRMRPDLVVVFQDQRSGKQKPRLGRLARRLVERSSEPVLVLPSAPLQVKRGRLSEHAEAVRRGA